MPPNLELPLTLTATAAGAVIATHTLTHPGDYECAQLIPPGDEVLVEFELDRALPPTPPTAASEPSWSAPSSSASVCS